MGYACFPFGARLSAKGVSGLMYGPSSRPVLPEVGTHLHNNAAIIFHLTGLLVSVNAMARKARLPDLNGWPPDRRNLNHSLRGGGGGRPAGAHQGQIRRIASCWNCVCVGSLTVDERV